MYTLLHHGGTFEVHLGANHKEVDIKKAVEKVANRDYPELNKSKISPIFIPEVFLTNYPEMLDYEKYISDLDKQVSKLKEHNKHLKREIDNELQNTGHTQKISKRKQELLKSIKQAERLEDKWKRVRGEYPERVAYSYLKDCFKDEETIVIHGHKILKLNDLEEEALEFEKDFIILNLTKRYILCIEVKSSCHQTSLEKSKCQLDGAKNLIEKWCSELLKDNSWKYYSAIYFHETKRSKEFEFCENCAKFIIFGDTFIEQFLSITKDIIYPTKDTEAEAREEYIKMAQYFIFLAAYEPVVTPMKTTKEVTKRVDKSGEFDNIIRWNSMFCFTRKQLPIALRKMPNEMLERVIFLSPASTGKTLIKKSNAKKIAEYGGKVLFLMPCFNGWETLLSFQLKQEFQGYSNIRFENVASSVGWKGILEKLENCGDVHVFIDEAEICNEGDISGIKQAAEMCKTFWLTVTKVSSYKNDSANKFEKIVIEDLQKNQFHIVRDDLQVPIRNTAPIVSKAFNIKKERLSITETMNVKIAGGEAQYASSSKNSSMTYSIRILKDQIDGLAPLTITDTTPNLKDFSQALKRMEKETQVLILIETQKVSEKSIEKLIRQLPKGSFHEYHQHNQDDSGNIILFCSD